MGLHYVNYDPGTQLQSSQISFMQFEYVHIQILQVDIGYETRYLSNAIITVTPDMPCHIWINAVIKNNGKSTPWKYLLTEKR